MMEQGILPLVLHGDYKTQLCRNWTPPNYNCPFGGHCWYAHGPEELQEVWQPAVLPLAPQPFLPPHPVVPLAPQPFLPPHPVLLAPQPFLPVAPEPVLPLAEQGDFKTEMCRNWKSPHFFCPYGRICRFAHGIEELRSVQRHPLYKTRDCRNDANGDVCRFGERCKYIHKYNPFGHPLQLTESFQEYIRRAAAAAGQNPPNHQG